MEKKSLTYRDAGVDISMGNASVEKIKPLVQSTYRPEVLADLGGFGGLFALDKSKYDEPVLVSGTDGVGTKLRVAFMLNRHDTIGIDAVAMCANDILVSGAEPLFFLDYVAVGHLEPEQFTQVVSGVAEGCRQAGCALIGGETAEMPGFYKDGEYDIAGFCVGVVDRKAIIDGSTITEGDVIIGLPSTGLHSNGYSLARKIFFDHADYAPDQHLDALGETVGDALMRPTKIYAEDVLPLINAEKCLIKGMAHITGGGLSENVPRILPKHLDAQFDCTSWPRPAVFDVMQDLGNVADEEMYRTFNMGLGFVLIVGAADADEVTAQLTARGVAHYTVGAVVAGSGNTLLQ